MKKKILLPLMILSFAFAGLFLVGNNVLGSGCNGQRGIEMTDAYGNCFCLHDPEPDSGNTCGDPTSESGENP
jgi:hypothetical protein